MASNCCCAAAWAAVRCAVVRSFANDATVTKPPLAGLPPLRNAAASGFWRPPGRRNGDVTELTPGTAARFWVAVVAAATAAGSARFAPATCRVRLSELAWLSSTRSWPACASLGADGAPECRRWNSDSPVTPPTATAKAATVITTQTSTNRHGCRAATPPSRASRVVGYAADEDSPSPPGSPGPPQAAAREERRARWPRLSVRGVVRQSASLGWRAMSDATDLFAQARDDRVAAGPTATGDSTLPPLAVRMRPRSLEEVRGQADVLRPGSPLRRLVEGSGGTAGPLSAIIWGPPGTGKTTLAHLVASASDRRFVELSAVTAGVKDVREVMDQARRDRDLYDRQTVLFLDEIHRFTKAQQDALLPGVENRLVVLVAATTENPSFSVIAPLLSRSVLSR